MDPAVDLTLRLALAALLATAAAHKLRDGAAFRAVLADYRLLPAALVPAGAVAVVAAELAAATLLVAPVAGRGVGPAVAAALFVVYGAAIGVNLARGRRHLDCGCGGTAGRQPIGGWMVVRNAVLVAAAAAALAPVAARPLGWVDGVTVAGAVATLAALWAAVDVLAAQRPAVARLRGGA